MILAVLEHVSQVIETLGITFNTATMDGTTEAKRISIGPVDPNMSRQDSLMMGWDFQYPVTHTLERPLFTRPVWRETNATTGEGILEPALSYLERVCALHVFFREVRAKPWERIGDNVTTAYARAEGAILSRLPTVRTQFSILDQNAVSRGFSVKLDNTFFLDKSSLTQHAIMMFRFVYPNVPSGVFGAQAFKPRKINLVSSLTVPEVSSLPLVDLLTLPSGAKHLILT